MATVILLGAGASYGSEDVVPEPPPLGNGEQGLFARFEQRGGEAATLPDDLKATFRANFEEGMATYTDLRRGDVMRFQRELAAYLASFAPGEGNVYRDLLRAVNLRHTTFVSLNYDLLLELAAGQLGLPCVYGLDATARCVKLIKPHGSSNFWPALPSGMFRECTFSNNGVDLVADVAAVSRAEALRRCASEGSLSPAIALYMQGKQVKVCPDYVIQQQTYWRQAVAGATNVFVMGVRVNLADEHIWGVLGKSGATVTYFGVGDADRAEYEAWRAHHRPKRACFVSARFADGVRELKRRLRR